MTTFRTAAASLALGALLALGATAAEARSPDAFRAQFGFGGGTGNLAQLNPQPLPPGGIANRGGIVMLNPQPLPRVASLAAAAWPRSTRSRCPRAASPAVGASSR